MRKTFLLFVLCLLSTMVKAQHQHEIEQGIRNSIEEFMTYVTAINDDLEPMRPETIGQEFRGGNYFLFNKQEISLANWLSSYSRNNLKRKVYFHSLTINSITKTSTNRSDRRYTVKGTLHRSTPNSNLIADEPLTMEVLWQGLDRPVGILSINFSATPRSVAPTTQKEYQFTYNGLSGLTIPWRGGSVTKDVTSQSRTVKDYQGTRKETTAWKAEPFTYTRPWGVAVKQDGNKITASVPRNNRHHTRTYTLTLKQQESGKSQSIRLVQNGKPYWFRHEYMELGVYGGLKYNFGITGMYTFDHSIFSLGAIVAANTDAFRGIEWPDAAVTSFGSKVTYNFESEETNGYKKVEEIINPQTHNYSELMDPNDEAKNYTQRMLFLLQMGFNATNWLRFDLGLGAAMERDLHFMETAYTLNKYSFEKTSPSLPDIPDVLYYTAKYKDYYYKDYAKWGFAVRPALNFSIPFDDYNDTALTIGLGYTYVAGMSKACSPDLTLGIRWKIY